MKTLSIESRRRGEMLVRTFSEKAQSVYNNTDPLRIDLLCDGTISIRGCIGNAENLTAEQAEKFLEDFYEGDEC